MEEGVVGLSYSRYIGLDYTPAASWSITDGELPPGLRLETNNSTYNYISGTPTKDGEYKFTITVTNDLGSDSKEFTISIRKPVPPEITTETLPDGVKGKSYTVKLQAADEAAWSIESGTLPPGLSLSQSGYISGTPNSDIPKEGGTYEFTVQATNVAGTETKQLSITIGPEVDVPIFSNYSFPTSGQVGTYAYGSFNLNVAANWSLTGDVDELGLYLDYDYYTNYNWVNMRPTKSGTWTFQVVATNDVGSSSIERTVTVTLPPAPTITTDNSVAFNATQGKSISWGEIPLTASSSVIWSAEDLPAGLYLAYTGQSQTSTNYILGTPTVSGDNITFTIKVANPLATELSSTKTFTINISEPTIPVITTASVHPDQGIAGKYYEWRFQADQSVRWTVEGDLPEGFNLRNYGQTNYTYIYGTPKDDTPITFTLRVTNPIDPEHLTSTKDFTINVRKPAAPNIITASLSNGWVGEYYEDYLEAADYAEWNIISGSLPPGLYFDYDDDGAYIDGRPTTVGTYTFTVRAANVTGTSTKQFTITIDGERFPPQITYAPSTATGTEGNWFSTSANSNRAATWSIESGTLPPGLSLPSNSTTSGNISGYPTTPGTYTFTIKASNSIGSDTRTITITISPTTLPPSISSWSVPTSARAGTYYSGYIVSNRAGTWSISSGELPPGLELTSDGRYAYVRGYPTTAGEYTFTVRVENSIDGDEMKFTINVTAPTRPVILTTSLPRGSRGVPYKAEILISGSISSYGYDYDNEIGLYFNRCYDYDENGSFIRSYYCIEGTPRAVGTYDFTLWVSNEAGSDQKTLSITVVEPPPPVVRIPEIAATTFSPGTVGINYNYPSERLQITNGLAVTWSVENKALLPPGISLSDNRFTGTPTEAGTYRFLVKAETEINTLGSFSSTRWFTITIAKPSKPEIAADLTLPTDRVVGWYPDTYLETKDNVQATWSIESGALPPGLELRNKDCYTYSNGYEECYDLNGWYIKGTTTEPGVYKVLLKTENSSGSSAKWFTITVTEPKVVKPTITTTRLGDGELRVPYSEYIYSNADKVSLESGTLPPGLSLNWGHIEGTPEEVGTYRFQIKAENGTFSTTQWLSITITNATSSKPEIVTLTLPEGVVDRNYEETYLETKDNVQATLSIESGALPPGLEITNKECDFYWWSGEEYCYETSRFRIKGAPTAAGVYKFLLKAENNRGSTTKWFTIKVTEPPKQVQEPRFSGAISSSRDAILVSGLSHHTSVEVFNIQGKRVYFGNSGTNQTMRIPAQTGMYIVKIGGQKVRTMVR